jgi:hypothetical protein
MLPDGFGTRSGSLMCSTYRVGVDPRSDRIDTSTAMM